MTETPKKPAQGRGNFKNILFIFGGLFLLFFVFASMAIKSLVPAGAGDNAIGVIEIVGAIQSSDHILDDIDSFANDESIKGILVRVDSPGGAVGASQEIFEALRRASKKKKVVVSMGNVAASGGFYIACAGDRVFANAGTVTGSIGVISQTIEAHELIAMAHLKFNTIKSAPFKDIGSPNRPFTDEDRAVYQRLITDIYGQFVGAVAESRGLDLEKFKASIYVDGRVFSGAEALEAGLVDELGGMQTAIDYLKDELDMKGSPTLIYPKKPGGLLKEIISTGASSMRAELGQTLAPGLEYRYQK